LAISRIGKQLGGDCRLLARFPDTETRMEGREQLIT
jgi:hypothetical protein